jgi:uncharacterized RDD family membrane protein YckC
MSSTGPASESGAGRRPPLAIPSIMRRAASMLYESLLVAAIVIVGGFAYFGARAALGGGEPGAAGPASRILLQVALVALLAGYFVRSWTRGGQTLAMKAWRLRLVMTDGTPVPAPRALGRFVLTAAVIVPALVAAAYLWRRPEATSAYLALVPACADFAWALVDPGRQFLHDRLAGTRIIFVRPTTSSPPQ